MSLFTHRITSQVDVEAAPLRVWAVLADLAGYEEWNPFIVQASGSAEAGQRLTLRMRQTGGRPMTLRPTVLEAEEGSRLRWLGRLGVPGLLDADHGFRIEGRADGGARLTQEEEFRGLLVPFLSRSLDTGTLPAFAAMNEALKQRVEEATTSRRG